MSRTKKLTKAAMLTALSTLALYAAGWLPRGALALTALCAMVTAVVVVECGCGWAAIHAAATFVLGFLLSPDRTLALWYGLFFGHYAIFKHWIEALSSAFLRWVLKLGLFYGCMAALYFLFSKAFIAAMPRLPGYVLALGLGAIFVLYDIAFSRLMGLYARRIHQVT